MSLKKRISYEEEKRKNPELKDSDVQILKDWYAKQRHLPQISDSEYALFLHCNYYHVEPTKNTIEAYYTIRSNVPDLFNDRDPIGTKQLREAFKVMPQILLSTQTKEGYKVHFTRLMDCDPSHFIHSNIAKYFFMMIDWWTYTEGTCPGFVIILDMEGLSFSHMTRLNPIILKHCFDYLQEAIPLRLKAIHFVNGGAIMDALMSLIKPLMKKELLELIHIHSTKESLDKYVPLKILPSDIGGKAKSMEEHLKEQVKKLEEHHEWFLQDEVTGRVNETLRVDDRKTKMLHFGLKGSFKKLDID